MRAGPVLRYALGHRLRRPRRAFEGRQGGPLKQNRHLEIEREAVPPCPEPRAVSVDGEPAGQGTSVAWSPDFNTNAAIAMIGRDWWDDGTLVEVATPAGPRSARVRVRSWL